MDHHKLRDHRLRQHHQPLRLRQGLDLLLLGPGGRFSPEGVGRQQNIPHVEAPGLRQGRPLDGAACGHQLHAADVERLEAPGGDGDIVDGVGPPVRRSLQHGQLHGRRGQLHKGRLARGIGGRFLQDGPVGRVRDADAGAGDGLGRLPRRDENL